MRITSWFLAAGFWLAVFGWWPAVVWAAPTATFTLTAPAGKVYKFTTDANGNFNFDVPSGQNYTVVVTAPGYQKLTFKWSPDQGKDYFTKIKLIKIGQPAKGSFEIGEAGNLRLLEGWNLITLNVTPANGLKAADLAQMINEQGGLTGVVSRFADGRWQSYLPVQGGPNLDQNNFEITPGAAYFVQNLHPSRFKFSGQPLTQPIKLDLRPGWNAIGLPLTANCLDCTGQKFLAISNQLSAISDFNSGLWQTVARAGDQKYGLDFPLAAERGYFLKSTGEVVLEP
jgi:hypothetical protein